MWLMHTSGWGNYSVMVSQILMSHEAVHLYM